MDAALFILRKKGIISLLGNRQKWLFLRPVVCKSDDLAALLVRLIR